MRCWKSLGSTIIVSAVMLAAKSGLAAGLGIPLDGFIGTMETAVTGMGLVVGTVGGIGYVGGLMDNPFSTILAGSVGFFTKAGILGGMTTLLGTLGLVGGATL